jgi:hypothetical protein
MLRFKVDLASKYLRAMAVSLGVLLPVAAEAAVPEIAYPTIPYGALVPYAASIESERLESMDVDRLWLRGNIDIKMDPLPDHVSAPTAGRASASFVIRSAPDFSVDFLAFPVAAFGQSIDNETLNAYLEGLRVQHTPEQKFEILKQSELSETGPSDFRILDQRAYHIRYSYIKDETTPFGVAESWIEDSGMIYVVRVEAPMSGFSFQLRDARYAFANMAEQ